MNSLKLIGLAYVGSSNGIGIQLFNSRKMVNLTWDEPYKFTSSDDTSEEAIEYYRNNYSKLGVNTITTIEDKPRDSDIDSSKELMKDKSDNSDDSTEGESESTEESDSEDSESEPSDARIDRESMIALISEYPDISSYSDSDLAEILDTNLEADDISYLCNLIGHDKAGRRSKSKIVSDIVNEDRDKLESVWRIS